MPQYKHSPFDEELLEAMVQFNIDKPASEKFNLIDARIISLIHSYSHSDKTFFASNQYLAEKCFSTPSTIQKSINKLHSYGLIDKRVACNNGKKQRVLSYNENGAKNFKSNPTTALPRGAWNDEP